MKKAQLVFIPSPGVGHLVSTLELAKLLVHRDERLSIAFLLFESSFDSKVIAYTESLASSNLSNRINFIHLLPDDESAGINFFSPQFIQSQKPHVINAVNELICSPDSPRLAGFVLDLFCTGFIDVAKDHFGVPSYIFFTSSAAFLDLMFYVQLLHDVQNDVFSPELKDSDFEYVVPGLVNPVPARVLPGVLLNKDWALGLYEQARRFRQAKGIIVNTFKEFESNVVDSFSDGKTPPVYPVGPILNLKGDHYHVGPGGTERKEEIMTWLDDQPQSSVVFLCFGSMGSFGEDQVKEIARGLEQCGQRFLWCLRQPSQKGDAPFTFPNDYENFNDVLPEGFSDRTAEIGKVTGWAPQVAILAHPAIGGFVSHCGWNSILESIWFGVPIATWPMYAEQQFNAFELVKELGLAVDIKMDYRKYFSIEDPVIVSSEEIKRGITNLMEENSEIRKRVKEMCERSRKALMDGGSSFSSLGCFINDVLTWTIS